MNFANDYKAILYNEEFLDEKNTSTILSCVNAMKIYELSSPNACIPLFVLSKYSVPVLVSVATVEHLVMQNLD